MVRQNVQRQDVHALDEAAASASVLREGGMSVPALTAQVSRSPQLIRDRLRILEHEEVGEAVRSGQITKSVGREMLKLSNEELLPLIERLKQGESLTVRDIEAARGTR